MQGHYVPAVASHIYRTNQKKDPSQRINLAGLAIGNGLTDPGVPLWLAGSQARIQQPVPYLAVACKHAMRRYNAVWLHALTRVVVSREPVRLIRAFRGGKGPHLPCCLQGHSAGEPYVQMRFDWRTACMLRIPCANPMLLSLYLHVCSRPGQLCVGQFLVDIIWWILS